jgi:hypothetical protein
MKDQAQAPARRIGGQASGDTNEETAGRAEREKGNFEP